jgi:hypothetical protein
VFDQILDRPMIDMHEKSIHSPVSFIPGKEGSRKFTGIKQETSKYHDRRAKVAYSIMQS